MKLLCIEPRAAHWGRILTKGKWYDADICEKEVEIITNYDEWYKQIGLGSQSITWIRKGYTQENLHEVLPGYMTLSEINRLYTKRIMMPHIVVRTDDNNTMSLVTLSIQEILDLGADVSKAPNRKKNGRPAFGYSVYLVDDFFDYLPTRRDNRLNELL
jgi:hypothetical protein